MVFIGFSGSKDSKQHMFERDLWISSMEERNALEGHGAMPWWLTPVVTLKNLLKKCLRNIKGSHDCLSRRGGPPEMKGSQSGEWAVPPGFLLRISFPATEFSPSPESMWNKYLQTILFMETPLFAIPDPLGQAWSDGSVQ